MIKVAGKWENGWVTPLQEYDLWRFPLQDFDVDEWYMFPITGMAPKRHVTEVHSLEDVIDANPDLTVIFLDEAGAEPLSGFEHPENALYVCGTAGYSPWKACGQKGLSVRIETLKKEGLLWPHQALSILLYDRTSKGADGKV